LSAEREVLAHQPAALGLGEEELFIHAGLADLKREGVEGPADEIELNAAGVSTHPAGEVRRLAVDIAAQPQPQGERQHHLAEAKRRGVEQAGEERRHGDDDSMSYNHPAI
jgi:hypothetical protein